MRHRNRCSVLVACSALAACVALVSGCFAVGVSKAGGGIAAEAVTIGVADATGTPAATQAETLADAWEEASGGAVEVEVITRAHLGADADDPGLASAFTGDTYAAVAELHRSGDLDLAIVPDFTWAAAGATELEALKVPFLIDSDALMLAVAAEAGESALSGLDSLGVAPLALLPEALRHPVGFDHPLQARADFVDVGVRVVDPYVGQALVTLGANPKEATVSYSALVTDGSIRGAETSFVQAATLSRTGIFTGDVVLGARFNVLSATADWYDGASTDMRASLAEAVDAAVNATSERHVGDTQAASAYCEHGGWIVHSGPVERDAIRAAVASAVTEIATEPAARDLIARIEELKSRVAAAEPPAACEPAVADAQSLESQAADSPAAPFPEGTYRARLAVEDFTSRGIDSATAANHAELWTLTFRDGFVHDIGCPGTTYTLSSDRITVVLGTGAPECGDIPGQELFDARWEMVGDALRFSDFGPTPMGPAWQTFNETLWGLHNWERVR